jgi:hypothetical protein
MAVEKETAHWPLIHQHSQEIGDLKAGQSRMEAKVEGLDGKVDSLAGTLRDGLDHVANALNAIGTPPEKQSWVPVAALALTVMIVLGGVISFVFGVITSSMQREGDLRFEAAEAKDDSIIRESDLRFDNARQAADDARDDLSYAVDELKRLRSEAAIATFENGKLTQRVEDLALAENRTHEATLVDDARVNEISVEAAASATALKAAGDFLKEHANKQGSAGHPSPDIKVSQPNGVGTHTTEK